MICPKCKKEAPEGASYCPYCGRLLSRPKVKTRRSNGLGSAYKRGSTWTLKVTIGSDVDENGRYIQKRKTKDGFKTKTEALAYAETLMNSVSSVNVNASYLDLYKQWASGYDTRVGSSTMAGYASAMKHYKQIENRKISTIKALDLQQCIDACTAGKRTKQLMKVVAGLIFKFAIDNDIVSKNYAANLYTGNDEQETRDPFTDLELQRIKTAVKDSVPYSDFVLAMCYLGFRPGELLSLKKSNVNLKEWFIIGGSKTEAGKDRVVPVPPVIRDIIAVRMLVPSEYIFPMSTGKKMSENYFRKFAFNPLMESLGISGKVPYSCRHTYSNLLKSAEGDSGDKARLMGHTDYAFTQKQYQSSSLDDLRKIVNQME